MLEYVLISFTVSTLTAVTMSVWLAGQGKKLAPDVLAVLRGRGQLTVAEIADAMRLPASYKNRIAMALGRLARTGAVVGDKRRGYTAV